MENKNSQKKNPLNSNKNPLESECSLLAFQLNLVVLIIYKSVWVVGLSILKYAGEKES